MAATVNENLWMKPRWPLPVSSVTRLRQSVPLAPLLQPKGFHSFIHRLLNQYSPFIHKLRASCRVGGRANYSREKLIPCMNGMFKVDWKLHLIGNSSLWLRKEKALLNCRAARERHKMWINWNKRMKITVIEHDFLRVSFAHAAWLERDQNYLQEIWGGGGCVKPIKNHFGLECENLLETKSILLDVLELRKLDTDRLSCFVYLHLRRQCCLLEFC